ncbi:hypothetical protein JXB41_01280 [Candidatus Woesearchaeota archaeon]|nr:hypothetical protein [Candidatus Woesearchaeota archaeon]
MLKVFKIKYTWYEGEEWTTYLTKDVETNVFEKDLKQSYKKAKIIAKELEEKGKGVDCRPEYYEHAINLLKKQGYKEIDVEVNETYPTYYINDHYVELEYFFRKRRKIVEIKQKKSTNIKLS